MLFIKYIDNKERFTTELDFSHFVIKHCPQLNLLSLVNETELTDSFILTASLAASDTVQVTLGPSITEIDVMDVMMSSLDETSHTSIVFTNMPVLIPTTTCFALATSQPASSTLLPMGTAVTQRNEASLYTLIAVVIGALSICFITTIISCTVIVACYCKRKKSQRTVTNAVETPVFQIVNHSYREMPCVNNGIYDLVKPKSDPLPAPPEEQYEVMNSIAYPADSTQTKTYINMV